MSTYVPQEGGTLTVNLPHEAIRATIANVINDDTIEADLNLAYPFTRLHGYDFGQRLKFKREASVFGERWVLVPGQPKAPPAQAIQKAQQAPGDTHDPIPDPVPTPQKAKRRSETDDTPRKKG